MKESENYKEYKEFLRNEKEERRNRKNPPKKIPRKTVLLDPATKWARRCDIERTHRELKEILGLPQYKYLHTKLLRILTRKQIACHYRSILQKAFSMVNYPSSKDRYIKNLWSYMVKSTKNIFIIFFMF